MIHYYQERNGDFLAIDTSTNAYYLSFAKDQFEGRATAIAGHVGSVCTTGISRQFLKQECRRIAKAKIPTEWRKAKNSPTQRRLVTQVTRDRKVRP